MQIEKINKNKVKIILTLEELEKRDVDIKDIEKNNEIAKELFCDLIEESNIDEEFGFDNSQLLIEATSDNNNLFIVTITKVDNMPDLKKYSLLEKKSKDKSKNKYNKNQINYKVDSYIYSYENIDNILDMCNKSKFETLFWGKNSLYKYNDLYYVIFAKSSVNNKKFLKTFIFLSEYCQNYYSQDIFSTAIKEKSKLIIQNNALQKLSKL